MNKLITREELQKEFSLGDNFLFNKAHNKAIEDNRELYRTINWEKDIELIKLLKQGEKPSKQMMELFFYWIEKDHFGKSWKQKVFKLLVKYGAYKPTLKELIKHGA